MPSYESSGDDERVDGPPSAVGTKTQKSGQDNGETAGAKRGPLLVGAAVAGIAGIAAAIGARFLLKDKKSKGKNESKAKAKSRSKDGTKRKVPPRRPRSIASSDVSSVKHRYVSGNDCCDWDGEGKDRYR